MLKVVPQAEHARFALSSRSPPILPVTTSSPNRTQRSTARSASGSFPMRVHGAAIYRPERAPSDGETNTVGKPLRKSDRAKKLAKAGATGAERGLEHDLDGLRRDRPR